MPSNLDDLLRLAANVLSAAAAPHALIGGCARNVYAPPRATRDVDLAVECSRSAYEQIAGELRAAGFDRITETKTDPDASIPDVALFSTGDGGRIDLVLAHTPFEERAIAAATRLAFPSAGTELPVVRVEDLIIYKALSARPRDLIDIEEIARFQAANGMAIDWGYIEAECAQWDALDVLTEPRKRALNP